MKQILSIIFLTITVTVFSQVTVSIEALEAGGVSLPNGSSIN
ncbi:hypothetical protein [Psychroflexus tropicus]|nr:hypothetical protein [Psychroflexus tropicus]